MQSTFSSLTGTATSLTNFVWSNGTLANGLWTPDCCPAGGSGCIAMNLICLSTSPALSGYAECSETGGAPQFTSYTFVSFTCNPFVIVVDFTITGGSGRMTLTPAP